MSTFVLIHGAGDAGWSWHLVDRALRKLGHDIVAPDLPCDDDEAGLEEYADTVVEAIGDRRDLIVVGHSFGGFTAPLVADRLPVEMLVLVAPMIPSPGETADDYWTHTGYKEAVRRHAARDGVTGHSDPSVLFYHDVPTRLAERARQHERAQSSTPGAKPWPLKAWPKVPTRCLVCTEDRLFPVDWLRDVIATRLAIVADEIAAGHCVSLSRPQELAARLDAYAASVTTSRRAGTRARPRGPRTR
jgi:pimeloyl-ACP methyl ester carboxylesterase